MPECYTHLENLFTVFLRPNCIIGIINVGDTQYLAFKKVQLNQFFVNSFAYYGLTMNIGDLAADNVYLNFAVSGGFQEKTKIVSWLKKNWSNTGLLEIPSYGLAVVILLYGGRRIPYFGCGHFWRQLAHWRESWNNWKLYWIDIPGQCSSVESHCSPFPWCQKANPPLSLSLRSLVR